jgi:quinol monooxygenase YgiN
MGFFEVYASPKAFDVHMNGSLFTTFVAQVGAQLVHGPARGDGAD